MLNRGKYVQRLCFVARNIDLMSGWRPSSVVVAGLKTGLSLCKIDGAFREARMLKKLMTGSRKKWPTSHEKASSPLKEMTEKQSNPRRVHVLNSLLLRYITDLMSSGELSHQLLGKSIEITGVKVSSDFSRATIFWYCGKAENSVEISTLLEQHSGMLRSQLSKLHLIGRIPYLYFAKDTYQERVLDVERLLAQADYGPDFNPETNKPKFELPSPDSKEVITTEKDFNERLVIGEGYSVKLRTEIYGLDRNAILQRVKERICSDVNQSSDDVSRHRRPSEFQLSSPSSLEKMADFIKKQKRLKSKLASQNSVHPNDAEDDYAEEFYKWGLKPQSDEINEDSDIIEDYDNRQYEK